MEYIVYHASVTSFKEFDENKITDCETDAPFNGFWFSSDPTTSSAWQRFRSPEVVRKAKIIAESLKDNDNIAI